MYTPYFDLTILGGTYDSSPKTSVDCFGFLILKNTKYVSTHEILYKTIQVHTALLPNSQRW